MSFPVTDFVFFHSSSDKSVLSCVWQWLSHIVLCNDAHVFFPPFVYRHTLYCPPTSLFWVLTSSILRGEISFLVNHKTTSDSSKICLLINLSHKNGPVKPTWMWNFTELTCLNCTLFEWHCGKANAAHHHQYNFTVPQDEGFLQQEQGWWTETIDK